MKSKIFWASVIMPIVLCCCKDQVRYTDGVYSGKSKAIYNDENFWGQVQITIKKGKIVDVDFKIIDSTLHEVFDYTYEKHYIGNDLYMQQCRDDWQGVLKYPEKLIKHQNIDDVDVISGATWSYNMLKYATIEALQNAKTQRY